MKYLLIFMSLCLWLACEKSGDNEEDEGQLATDPLISVEQLADNQDNNNQSESPSDLFEAGGNIEISANTLAISEDVGSDVELAIITEESMDLLSTGVLDELSIADETEGELSASSLLIIPNLDVEVKEEFTIKVPEPKKQEDTSANLITNQTIENLVVFYRVFHPEDKKFYSGLVPSEHLQLVAGKVLFKTKYFGAFQAVKLSKKIDTPVEVLSRDQELRNVKNIIKLDVNGFGAAISSIENPAKGFIIHRDNALNFTLNGYCSDNGKDVTLSGPMSLTTPCAGNKWSGKGDLTVPTDGTLKINFLISHERADGETFSKTYSYDFAYKKPEVTIQGTDNDQTANWYTAESEYSFSGTCTELGKKVFIKINQNIDLQTTCKIISSTQYEYYDDVQKVFDWTITLSSENIDNIPDGEFTVTVTQFNSIQDKSEASTTFFKSTSGPQVTLIVSGGGSCNDYLTENTINLQGECSEVGEEVVFSGAISGSVVCGMGTQNNSANYWYSNNHDISALADGVLALKATQTNELGETMTFTKNLTKSVSSPVVHIPEDAVTTTEVPYGGDIACTANHDSCDWNWSGPGTVSDNPHGMGKEFSAFGTYNLNLTCSLGGNDTSDTYSITVEPFDIDAPTDAFILNVPGKRTLDVFKWLYQGTDEVDAGNDVQFLLVYHEGNSSSWNTAKNWRPTKGTTYSAGQSITYSGQNLKVIDIEPMSKLMMGLTTQFNVGSTYYFMVFNYLSSLKIYSSAPLVAEYTMLDSLYSIASSVGGDINAVFYVDNGANDKLYVGNKIGGVNIYSVAGNSLTPDGFHYVAGEVTEIYADTSRAYISINSQDGYSGVDVLDISDTTNPTLLKKVEILSGSYPIPIYNVFYSNNQLYTMIQSSPYLQIFDITDLNSVSKLGDATNVGYFSSVFVESNTAYVSYVGSPGSLRTYDISSPETGMTPDLENTSYAFYDISKKSGEDLFALYKDGTDVEIGTFEVTGLTITSSWDTGVAGLPSKMTNSSSYSVFTGANKLFIADKTNLSGSNASLDVSLAGDVAAIDEWVYVARGQLGLSIVDIDTSPLSLALDSTIPIIDFGNGQGGIATKGNYLYIVDNTGDLKVMDITNHYAPGLFTSFVMGGSDIQVDGDYGYVNYDGFTILNLTTPSTPTTAGNDNSIVYSFAAIEGNYAYIIHNNSGLMVSAVNITNKSSPALEVGSGYQPPNHGSVTLHDIKVVGSTVYIAGGSDGLLIVDYSNPGSPSQLGNYAVPTNYSVESVYVSGDYAYIGINSSVWDDPHKMQILNISDPANITIAGYFLTGLESWDIEDIVVVGNIAYIVDSSGSDISKASHVYQVDISNPFDIYATSVYAATGNLLKLIMHNGDAVLKDGVEGIVIMDLP